MGTNKRLRKQKTYKSSIRENVIAGRVNDAESGKWIPENMTGISAKSYDFQFSGVVKGKRQKKKK